VPDKGDKRVTIEQATNIADRFETAAKTFESEGKQQRQAGAEMRNAAEKLQSYAKTLELRGEDLQRLAQVCRDLSSFVVNEITD
jgi:hypothetical protein